MRFAALSRSEPAGPAGQDVHFVRLEGGRAVLFDRAPWDGGRETGESCRWTPEQLRCPVAPSKIVCVGRNYVAHARELGHEVPSEPLLFLKPPSSLAGPGEAIVLPPESARVEHEAELAVVIGRRARKIERASAFDVVFGYTCACDVTARDLQRKDVQFTRAKGFDTFCPIGPWVETSLEPQEQRITCKVRGELRQNGSTSDMLFDVPTIVAFISRMMTLEAGDVILTGTPEGVGPIQPGDDVDIAISGIGSLTFRAET